MHILVTGATGYVGGRLIPRLIELGHRVSILVRNPTHVEGRPWHQSVEVIQGDLLSNAPIPIPETVTIAYYLVHSMAGSGDFQQADIKAASRFTQVLPPKAHVIYLGGIRPEGTLISKHLKSRIEVGAILARTNPTTEFRAGPIIGSGSASFEMVRNLTERLPIMIAPKWVNNLVRPIAIRDMLSYLIAAAEVRHEGTLDVGGSPLTFLDMMKQWAVLRKLRRFILPVPILAPKIAARWVGWVTPIPNRIAIPLVQGMLTSIIGDTSQALKVFPGIRPMPYHEAISLAQQRMAQHFIETRWSGSMGCQPTFVLEEREGIIHETRIMRSKASAQEVFDVFITAGGTRGWFAWNWAWTIRGVIDRWLGGPGLRRGRRHPHEVFTGESIDFWRVEKVLPGSLLRLRAEMKVPGQAWLEWRVSPDRDNDGSMLTQTAFFNPSGLAGRLYWIALYPIHGWIFSDMARAIIRHSERMHGSTPFQNTTATSN